MNECRNCVNWLNFGNQERGRCLVAAPLEPVEEKAKADGATDPDAPVKMRMKIRSHAMTSASDGCEKGYVLKEHSTERKPVERPKKPKE